MIPVPISNGPVVIHSPIDDTSTPDKRIEGLLEEVNQVIVRKETFQILIRNTHSYEKSNEGLTGRESEIYKLKNILSHPIERLQIPPFAEANVLVQINQTNINTTCHH